MIDKVQISEEELRNLHEKGVKLDPNDFDLSKITNSGSHIGDVEDQSFLDTPQYNLDKLSESGSHVADVIDE